MDSNDPRELRRALDKIVSVIGSDEFDDSQALTEIERIVDDVLWAGHSNGCDDPE